MPYIKVNVDKIKEYQQDVYNIRRKVNTISSSFSNISGRLDSDVKSSSGIRRKLQNIESTLSDHKTVLQRANTFLGNASLKYINAENNLYVKDKASGNAKYTDIDEMAKSIAKQKNLSTEAVRDIILSGEYSVADVVAYANGVGANGAFSKGIEKISSNTAKVSKKLELSESETDELLSEISAETGVPKENIAKDIKEGLEPANEWLSKIEKHINTAEKWIRRTVGATDIVFKMKDGQVIVSQFTRSGLLNNITKLLHGKGIATHYNPSTLLKTPGVGTIYAINKIAHTAEVVAGVVDGAVKVLDATGKIIDVINNDSLSTKEKICTGTAIGVTSVAAAALEVGAPIAGKAVTTAVTALIPIPGVNVVAGVLAGAAVKSVMNIAADVITSETVVNQVSESVGKIGDAVVAGKTAVSNVGKKVLESKNAGEAVVNTAKLVGTAVVAGVKTVKTAVEETKKVVKTVVKETAKAVVNEVKNTAKKVVNWIKKW